MLRQPTDEIGQKYLLFKNELHAFFIATHNNKPLVLSDASMRKMRTIQVGDPLFHILTLCYYGYTLRQAGITDMILLEPTARHISNWMAWQHQHFDHPDVNEFQLGDNPKDTIFFSTSTVESILREIGQMTMMELNYSPELKIAFANNFHLLLKKLMPMYRPQQLSGQKDFIAAVKVAKFETDLYTCSAYIEQGDYIAAEVHANKSWNNIGDICPKERGLLRCVLLSNLAYIQAQQHDVAGTMHYLEEFFTEVAQTKDKNLFKNAMLQSRLSKACDYVADSFIKDQEIHKAIIYLQTALEYEMSVYVIKELQEKIKSLEAALVTQIDSLITNKKYTYLAKIQSYPKNHLIYFYFTKDQDAKLLKHDLNKHGIKTLELKKDPNKPQAHCFAISISYDFAEDTDKLLAVMDKAQKSVHKEAHAELNRQQHSKPAAEKKQASNEPARQIEYTVHPKTATRKVKKKSVKETPNTIKQTFRPGIFANPITLQRVEFNECGLTFDPHHPTGVVALRVNNMSGKWFAFINPDLAKELPDNQELIKIIQRFQSETELGNDCCVSCIKEMKVKEKSLGKELPYIFKIRLLGKGNGDIRLYAKLIEVTADNKSLVVFTAINRKSHAKDTRPTEIALPTSTASIVRKSSK